MPHLNLPSTASAAEAALHYAWRPSGRPMIAEASPDELAPVWDGLAEAEPEPTEPLVLPTARVACLPEPAVYRLPPRDLDAERATLGSLLIDPDALGEVSAFLAPSVFYRQIHGLIYGAIVAIDARGEPLDVVTVAAELERTGDLKAVGGAAFLSSLANETPTAVHVRQYGRLVADRSRERSTIQAARRIAEAAYERDPNLDQRVSEIVASLPRSASRAMKIGNRTAFDLLWCDAPPPLAGPYLTPEGPTVIYARGGTGKGVVCCWFIKRLVAAGHVVMIIDYEGHQREWGSRLRGLGLSDVELANVHYRAPWGPDWTTQTGALAVVADLIRDDAERLGVTYLVVDSFSVATSNGDTMGGEQAAREYFSALARIGLPSCTIAHVRGDSGRFPDRPFGSVFVHNLARETWAVERLGDGQSESGSDLPRMGAHLLSLELRNKKANAGPLCPAQFVTFSFFGDGKIEVSTDRPADHSIADLAADVLARGPATLAAITAAIKEDAGRIVTEDSLRTTLKRHPRRFEESSSGRPKTWSAQ